MEPAQDHLFRFYFEEANVRGVIVQLRHTWQQIAHRDDYPEHVRRWLAQVATASALFAGDIKFEGSVSVHLKTGSGLRLVFAECSSEGRMRGVARWHADAVIPASPADLTDASGVLALTVMRETGEPKWQGLVPLEGNSLAESFEAYFSRSEQLPTSIHLAFDGQSCAGLLLQEVPGEGGIARERDAAMYEYARAVAATVTERELLDLTPEEVLHRLFHEETVRLNEAQGVRFECRCSRDRAEHILRSIGEDEARAALDELGMVTVTCEFCNGTYAFDAIDVSRMFIGSASPISNARN
ncbi:MAG: Hsp33 family molecular chaperone HslO [Ahniella sp.]|nr:Hsp33 family molecular chaperone HslO [Ahniella sp.]